MWAHPRMLHPATWRQAVPPNMRRLPRPLAGHCAVDIRDNISTVLTTFMLTPCILHFMFFSPEHILVLGGSTHPANQFGLMNYRSAHSSTVPNQYLAPVQRA